MSLCYLMVSDFKHGTGRFEPENPPLDRLLYSDSNLEFGIAWAEDLISQGYEREPFHDYDLREFVRWATEKLS